MAASFFPTLYLFVPKAPVLAAAVALFAVAAAGEWLRFRNAGLNALVMRWLRPLTKEKEAASPFASTYLLAATSVAVAAFPQPVAVLALFSLALGDPLAALIGERFGAHRIAGRSLEGSAAFLLASLGIGGALLGSGLDTTVGVMVVGAVAAALFELAPLGLDDNVKVPLGSGGVMALAHHFWA